MTHPEIGFATPTPPNLFKRNRHKFIFIGILVATFMFVWWFCGMLERSQQQTLAEDRVCHAQELQMAQQWARRFYPSQTVTAVQPIHLNRSDFPSIYGIILSLPPVILVQCQCTRTCNMYVYTNHSQL